MRRQLIMIASAALLGVTAAPVADAGPHLRAHRLVSETSAGKHVPRRHARMAKGKVECPFCSGVTTPR